jgi:hypothetical protein
MTGHPLRNHASKGKVAGMLHIDRQIAIWAGWIAGPAFGVAMMAAPEYLKLEPPYSGVLFWGGLIVFFVTIIVVVALSLHDEGAKKRVVGPILTMALGSLILGAGVAWYFWPGAITGSQSERSSYQDLFKKSPPSDTLHLVRSLAFDQFAPAIIQEPNGPFLHGFGGRVNNVGQDMLYWHIEEFHLYLSKDELIGGAGNSWTYLSPTQGANINFKLPNDMPIAIGTEYITLEMIIKYDTVPSTGIRTSFRKTQYNLNWVNGNSPLIEPHVVDQREN